MINMWEKKEARVSERTRENSESSCCEATKPQRHRAASIKLEIHENLKIKVTKLVENKCFLLKNCRFRSVSSKNE